MKKLLILFVVLIFGTGFVLADGLGLTAGLEFGIVTINQERDEWEPYIEPGIIYETSLFGEALDIYAELAYRVGFFDAYNNSGEKVVPMDLYANLALGYNLSLGSASTLSFLAANEIDRLIVSPKANEGFDMLSRFMPGVRFTQNMNFGDLYAEAIFPIYYMNYDRDAGTSIDIEAAIGWQSNFGFGISLTEIFNLSPDSGHSEIYIIASYESGPVYVGFEVGIPTDLENNGITVIPELSFNITGGLSVYAYCEFTGVIGKADMTISPALGVTYSF